MKTTYHVPTESFGFIEIEAEDSDRPLAFQIQERVEAYKAISEAVKGTPSGEGIPDKEYNQFMDNFLMGNMNGLGEIYQAMSKEQQSCVQVIKKSLKRIKARQNKGVEDYSDETLSDIG